MHGDSIVTAVDAKPKSTLELRRLENIASHPRVSLVVDHYDDQDWARLWWVRADGHATVRRDGSEYHDALDALVAKYEQYRTTRPLGAVIVIEPLTWRFWSAS